MATSNKDDEKKEQKTEKPVEETVVVSRVQLADILNKLERLEATADKARLESFDNKNKPKELSRVRLNVYEDPETMTQKVVMAWKMLIDEVIYDRVRGYVERQTIELTLEDDTKVAINYGDFSIGKRRKQQPAEILSRKQDSETGTEILTVRRVSDMKQFDVDSRFIN